MMFIIHSSSNGKYYFDVVTDNGEALCHSETYVHKEFAKHVISTIQNESSTARILDFN